MFEAQCKELTNIRETLENEIASQGEAQKLLKQEAVKITDQYQEIKRQNNELVANIDETRALIGSLEASLEAEKTRLKNIAKE